MNPTEENSDFEQHQPSDTSRRERWPKKQRGAPPDEDRPLSPYSEQKIPDELAELTVQIKEKEIELKKWRVQIEECEKLNKDIPERLLRNESSVLAILESLLRERLTLRERPSESAPRLSELSSPKVPPDSRNRGTILPSTTDPPSFGELRLHFVNRDEAMRNLLKVHRSILFRRMPPNPNSGEYVEVPLMDALFGMGKTTFAQNYLALVARYVANLYEEELAKESTESSAAVGDAVENVIDHLKIELSPSEREKPEMSWSLDRAQVHIVDRVLDRLSYDIRPRGRASGSDTRTLVLAESPSEYERPTSPGYTSNAEIVLNKTLLEKELIADLLDARTMYLDCSGVSLLDTKKCGPRLTRLVREGLKPWGITVPVDVEWDECVDLIPKPVFIVFDEIGKSFTRDCDDPVEQRKCFFRFVSDFCDPLSRKDGVYYLLCGRAPFLWDVGMRSDHKPTQLGASPAIFRRINLNPIRKEYYSQILEKTFIDKIDQEEYLRLDAIVKEKCPKDLSYDMIIDKLYIITCGHSRSLCLRLKSDNPTDPQDESNLLLEDVRQALERFPEGIKQLFENRHKLLDLTSSYKSNGDCTFEYLATRIHAGFGSNVRCTPLQIPPIIESYLMRRFLPFIQFVIAHEYVLDEHYLDKSRVFESIILKWLESVFSNSNKTVGELLGDFCPKSSRLHSKSFTLDPKKTLEGCRILGEGYNEGSCETTISRVMLASRLLSYFADKSVNIYFPAKLSYSPDILILPQIEDGETFLIGVQVICHSRGRIAVNDCIEEAERFYDILKKTRESSVENQIKGVLLLCATCGSTQQDFPELNAGCKAFIWSHPDMKEWTDFEVIILNLSTASSRKEFFNLAQGADHDDSEKITDLIERVISYAD